METRFIQLRQKNIDRYLLKNRLSETLLLVVFAIFNFVLFISTLISPPRRQNARRVPDDQSISVVPQMPFAESERAGEYTTSRREKTHQ
jgi:hypothetical protein